MLLVIGHRGASADRRENTLEAFLAAERLGAHGVELDVRRTADGALAVHHDAVLPSGQAISNIRGDELPAEVATLPAVFDALPAGFLIDVEVKNAPNEPDWDPDESVAHAVAALVRDRGREAATLVTSFNLNAVDVARAAGLWTGWLTLPGYDQAWALDMAADHGHRVVLPRHESVDPAFVDAARAKDVAVWTWTVDDPARIRELAALGVDAVITNDPATALSAL